MPGKRAFFFHIGQRKSCQKHNGRIYYLSMLDVVERTIAQTKMLKVGQLVVVGVSGGADSTALLHCLLALSKKLGFIVYAAHLNHKIRGKEADEDQRFVAAMCERWDVPFYTMERDVLTLAKRKHMSLEQAAREARYQFFEKARIYFNADKIAVAHHMEDQAETVLMHLLRGSGLAGLTGMHPVRGRVVRPFLQVDRVAIEEYIRENGLAYRYDSTNSLLDATRNRLRLEVFPYLSEHINPGVIKTFCSAAELLQRDEDYLMELAGKALCEAELDAGYDRAKLAALPLPIKTRALRLALARSGIEKNIERVHIEALCDLLTARTGAELILPGIEALISYDRIYVGKRPQFAQFAMPLVAPGETVTPRGRFHAMIVEGIASFSENRMVGCMDYDALPGDLTVRPRANGDQFFPVGAPGNRKLKEFFIDRKVPRFEREVPLLCSMNRVLFVPGYGIDSSVRVTEQTTRVLWLAYSNE